MHPRSLKSLIVLQSVVFLILIIMMAGLGGLGVYFWRHNSQESLELSALLFQTQQLRGDIYREIKEISTASLTYDQSALNRYWQHLYQIDRRFYEVDNLTKTVEEKQAVVKMRHAYELMQSAMNRLFADTRGGYTSQKEMIDAVYETHIRRDFEAALNELTRSAAQRRQQMENSLAQWSKLAPFIVSLPIIIAMGLLLYVSQTVRRKFIRPMRQLVRGAERISTGELTHRIPQQGVTEASSLAEAMNHMAEELTASRDALLDAERQAALGSLVPVVAHNIRNPLASIRAASQMLEASDDDAELEETRDGIIDTVDRLERWVNALLTYLRPLGVMKKSHQSVAQIVDNALQALDHRLQEKSIQINRHNWNRSQKIPLDADLLEQAIYGLLNNAVEASPTESELQLDLASDDTQVTLIIEDNGSGMPFNPQPTELTPGPSTKRFGTGLGIPFAFKIVQAHGGSLTFEKANSGGTRVRLTIPTTEN